MCLSAEGIRLLPGMAPIFQLSLGTCLWAALALSLFTGSWGQTDEQHFGDLADVNKRENADILLELLWGGIEIMANETIKIQDEELASLRPAKRLLWILQHEIPKNPTGIEEHLDYLSQSDTPLTAKEFEQLIFTTVYCAYQVRSIQGLEKNLWINLFSQLVIEITHELCKQFCPKESMDSIQLLASRPWQEIPVYISALKKLYRSSLVTTQRHA
ncbi:protein FAM180B [Varanus komodoensis]|uniref:Family with sequence similarity 180 member B n=1 Tax=Varanus komodoensis TaxID=61221 RepID=A0A8D2LXL8_VARKO|nr:protein FAM180B [Varanus komodoensis]